MTGNSRGTIQLNGAQVFGPNYPPVFSQHVNLLQSNTLQVQLASPFEALAITIWGYRFRLAGDYAGIPILPTPGSDDVDWRQKGAVTPVKNQGACQASWAFSATAAMEGWGAVTGKGLESLSEQQLLDCADVVMPCNGGGSPAEALKYAIADGSESERAYPYTGKVGTCQASDGTPVTHINGILRSLPGDEGALRALVAQGPVSVVLNGNWLSSYASIQGGPGSSGQPVNPCAGNELPPVYVAATIVGFQLDSWIVKFSLGTTWGANGYLYLLAGQNVCGIADYAVLAQ